MWRDILKYGVIAGLVVGGSMYATIAAFDGQMPHGAMGMALGYATMLVAFSAVFVGIKHHRDVGLGGVIRFWPAFAVGLAISFIASVFYVVSWELAQATLIPDFARHYAETVIAQQKADGVDAAALAKLTADMETFKLQYANPLFRLPMTFVEIFPVGVLVSLVSALVLRNPRVLPARG
ncbi:MAG: DUF4199 domain-containing protein [Pseudoxanthomonas sp.]